MKRVLTIAGSDSGGGAGIQADIKTFCAHNVFGMSAITAVTAQNTVGVSAIEDISPWLIYLQITSVLDDIGADSIKIGMLSRTETITAVENAISRYSVPHIVLDPVMVSTSGSNLLNADARTALCRRLFPLSSLVTPNIPEAEALTGIKIADLDNMEKAAKMINSSFGCSVLVKGGHSVCDSSDLLLHLGKTHVFEGERIDTKNTHGTGCTLSSAIASNLALGHGLAESVRLAKEYVTCAIRHSLDIGKGCGPTNHMHALCAGSKKEDF